MHSSNKKEGQPHKSNNNNNNNNNNDNSSRDDSFLEMAALEIASSDNEFDYEEVLEKIGFGKTQLIQLLMSGLLTLTSMAAQTSVGILAIAMQCEFNMTQTDKGIMIAACTLGVVLSTYIWGYISDAYGRRTVLLITTLITNLFQFMTMFITNIWFFNFINLLMGISLGGITAAIYAYLSEFNTSKYRAVVINYSTMFVSIAAIYVPATAWWVLSYDWTLDIGIEFRPWRLIILLALLPGLIGVFMLYPYPESPKLLLAQNKEDEAIAAVEWISKFNTGRSVASILKVNRYKLKPELLDSDDILSNKCGCDFFVTIWKATVPLFHKPHRGDFIISAVVLFGLFFGSAGLQIWYPEIVNRSSGNAANNSSTVCEILDASFEKQAAMNMNDTALQLCDNTISAKTYIDNMIVGFAFLVGFAIQGTLLNPLGRKNVLLAALTIATFSGILMYFVSNTTVVLILFCLYLLMPGLSISIMCGAVVDLVPTNLRGKAVSVCMTTGRLGVIVAANLIAVMLEPLCKTTFGIFTGSMFVCLVLVYLLPI